MSLFLSVEIKRTLNCNDRKRKAATNHGYQENSNQEKSYGKKDEPPFRIVDGQAGTRDLFLG
jgi:hypothetical protein